ADPTVKQVGTVALGGATLFDEEGVPAQKVALIKNGTFKQFLMSRRPRTGFDHSTGSGRSSWFSPVRAHPSSLFLTSTKGMSEKALRKQAIAAAVAEDLDLVLVVERYDTTRFEDYDNFSTSILPVSAS